MSYSVIMSENDLRIRKLQGLYNRAQYDLECALKPPVETQTCSNCNAELPLTDFKRYKNLKHTKSCLKCLEKVKQRRLKIEPDLDTESTHSSLAESNMSLFETMETINNFCDTNNTTVIEIARREMGHSVGLIMDKFHQMRRQRNAEAHPQASQVGSGKEIIDLLMNYNY